MRRARRTPMSRPNTRRRARLRRACGRAMFTARAGRGALQGGIPSPTGRAPLGHATTPRPRGMRPNTRRRARLRRACGRAMFTARAGRGALQGGVPSPLRPGGTRTQVRPATPVPRRDTLPRRTPCAAPHRHTPHRRTPHASSRPRLVASSCPRILVSSRPCLRSSPSALDQRQVYPRLASHDG